MTQSAEGTKESRTRVSKRGFFDMVALRPPCLCVRACVHTCPLPTRTVAYVPKLPAQSYFAIYSELNNCCRAALN